MRFNEIPRNTIDVIQAALLTDSDEDIFIARGKVLDEAPAIAMAHYKVQPDGKVYVFAFNKDLDDYEYVEVVME